MAALVQEIDARSNTTLTFGAGVTSGNAVLVAVFVLSTTVTVSSVEIGGNALTAVPGAQNLLMSHAGPGGDGARVSYFYRANVTGSPTGVTVTLSGTPGDTSYIQAWEVSGLGTSIVVDDAENSGSVVTANNNATVSFTTTGSGFAISVIGSGGTGTFTPGSGWTTSFSDAGSANFMHRVIASAGSYTADATVPSSWNATVVAFLDGGGGGGGGDTLVVVGNPQRNRRTSGRRM